MEGSNLLLLQTYDFYSLDNSLQQRVFHEFYLITYKQIMAMINDRNAAQDLIQEAFIKTISHAPPMTNENQLRAWIKVLVRNMTLNYLRKMKKERNYMALESVYVNNDDVFKSFAASPEKEIEGKLLKEYIISQLPKLKPGYRFILELRWKRELSYKEIVDELGTTEDIIRQKLFRAREALKKLLSQEWGDYNE